MLGCGMQSLEQLAMFNSNMSYPDTHTSYNGEEELDFFKSSKVASFIVKSFEISYTCKGSMLNDQNI